jgi:hypothetical protein
VRWEHSMDVDKTTQIPWKTQRLEMEESIAQCRGWRSPYVRVDSEVLCDLRAFQPCLGNSSLVACAT